VLQNAEITSEREGCVVRNIRGGCASLRSFALLLLVSCDAYTRHVDEVIIKRSFVFDSFAEVLSEARMRVKRFDPRDASYICYAFLMTDKFTNGIKDAELNARQNIARYAEHFRGMTNYSRRGVSSARESMDDHTRSDVEILDSLSACSISLRINRSSTFRHASSADFFFLFF